MAGPQVSIIPVIWLEKWARWYVFVVADTNCGQQLEGWANTIDIEQRLHTGDEQIFDNVFLCWIDAKTKMVRKNKLTTDVTSNYDTQAHPMEEPRRFPSDDRNNPNRVPSKRLKVT